MANFYFYTEPNKLEKQTKSKAFGLNNLKINLSSHHSTIAMANNNPKAYAVTSGRLCALKMDGFSDFFTLLLQPDNQPKSGAVIKYFVYKKILKSSILDSAGLIYKDTDPEATDLTRQIQKDYKLFFDDFVGNIEEANEKCVGLNYPQELYAQFFSHKPSQDEIPVDALFYAKVDAPLDGTFIPLPRVKAGDEIGTFNKNSFSFEIMLDNQGFDPEIWKVIRSNNEINTDDTLNNLSFVLRKSEILNYQDPAAFYGSLAQVNGDNGVKIKPFDNHYLTGKDIYENILKGVQYDDSTANAGIFYTRNYLYIDIRDRYNNPYNFHKARKIYANHMTDYDLEIQTPDNNAGTYGNPKGIKYHEHGDELKKNPILVLDNFSSQTINISFQKIEPEEYVFLHIDNKEIIEDSPGLRKSIDMRDNFTKLLSNSGTNNFTKPIKLKTVVGHANKTVANYIKLRYIRHTTKIGINFDGELGIAPLIPTPPPLPPKAYYHPLEYRESNYLDFIFPVDMNLRWIHSHVEKDIASMVYYEGVYIDNTVVSGKDFMGNIGIARDAGLPTEGNYYFFAYNTQPTKDNEAVNGLIDRSFSLAPISLDVSELEFDDSELFLKNLQKNTSNITHNVRDIKDDGIVHHIHEVLNSYKESSEANNDRADEGKSYANNINDFIFLTMSKVDYASMMNQFDSLQSGVNQFLYNSKVYLGIEIVKLDSDGHKDFMKVKYVLKGLRRDGTHYKLETEDLGIFGYMFIKSVSDAEHHDMDSGEIFVSEGKAYSISSGAGVDTINSSIYFIKDPNINKDEFIQHVEFIKKNIHQVWNTNNNKGLTEKIGGGQSFTISDSGIEYKRATPLQYGRAGGKLKDKEIIVKISKKVKGIGRSMMGGRYGNWFFEDKKYTPAHEFGHALGLVDRYAYIAKVNFATKIMNDHFGSSVILYLPSTYDPDYTSEFRWWNNLFSTSDAVPNFNNLAPYPLGAPYNNLSVPDEYFHKMMPYRPSGSQITVFITPKQWEIIKHYKDEKSEASTEFEFERYIYFIDDTHNFSFRAFVGYDRTLTTTNKLITDSNAPNNTADDMLGRVNPNKVKAVFHPFKGNSETCPLCVREKSKNTYNRLRISTGFDYSDRLENDIKKVGLDSEDRVTKNHGDISPNSDGTDYNTSEGCGDAAPSIEGDEKGKEIWDYRKNNIPMEETPYGVSLKNSDGKFHDHKFSYDGIYPNRLIIINLINNGKLP